MNKTQHARRLIIVLSLQLSGCMVGPDYSVPQVAMPVLYKEASLEENRQPDIWVKAKPEDAIQRGKWWEAFGDPELNTLEDQVTVANQDLKAAEARFREARALVGYHKADEYPTISAIPSAESLRYSAHQPYFTEPNPPPTAELEVPLDLSYEIDFWGRVRRTVAAARAEAQASAADLETAGLSLHTELAIDYTELTSADAQQKILNDTVAAYQDTLKLTEDRLAGGAASESDVALAQTQLETTRVQATDVAVLRAQYEHAIAVLIGKPPSDFSLSSEPRALNAPVVPVGLPSQLLERRPDIAAAERRVAEGNEQIGIAEAAFYPTVTLDSEAGFIGSAVSGLFAWPNFAWAVGTTASQVVFDAGRRKFQSEAVAANYDNLVAAYRQTTLTAFQQVEDNLSAIHILEREAGQQKRAVEAAKHSLEVFTNRYLGGLDPYLQVVTAQSSVLFNQRNEVDIQRRRLEADMLLIKALGGGWNQGSDERYQGLEKITPASNP